MGKKRKTIPIHIHDMFGRWEIIREIPGSKRGKKYLCRCECGTERKVLASSLRSGRSKSCGCSKTKHGMSHSKIYRAWVDMIQRCVNENHIAYPDYGGRGIQVCDEWRKSFTSFYTHIGDSPDEEEHWSVDRKDVEKDYEPGNVRWATAKEQANNRRSPKKHSARRRNEYVPTEEQWEDAQKTSDVLNSLPKERAPF